MSLEISLGGMVMSSMSINDGVHKLPKDCYPPTESESEDGEESFVVLNDPESSFVNVVEALQPGQSSSTKSSTLSPASIDRSLNTLNDMAQSVLNQTNLTLLSFNEPMKSVEGVNTLVTSITPSRESTADSIVEVNGQELNLSMIQSRVHTFSLENAQLKEAVKQNNIAMKDQCEKIVNLQEEYRKSTEQGRNKLQHTIQQIDQLTVYNKELKFICDEQKKVISQLQEDIKLLNKSKDELKSGRETLDKISMANMKNFHLECTESKLKQALNSLEETTQMKEALEYQLRILETQSESLKFRHLEEIARLKEKIINFQEKEENYNQSEIARQTMVDQMTEMQMKIVEMNLRMNDIVTKNGVLKEQLKIYQNDFQEEREDRQKLKLDGDQLKTDLEFTRSLNEDLKAENALLKDPNAPSKPPPSKGAASDVYVCAWCQFGFLNHNALKNHYGRCPEAFEQV